MKRSSFILLVFALFLSACGQTTKTRGAEFSSQGIQKGPKLTLEVADTAASRKTGLMYRREMKSDSGMLFIFPDEAMRSFWMKNTYLELDMIFISAKNTVVSISERTRPLTERSYKSSGPAKYVVEVNGGSAAKWGLRAGDSFLLE